MRGLRVGLVEQHDFASGTSSRSSRLLHGGLRYLAQGRLGLVREASLEKRILHRIAPHLVEPLAFIFPTYRHTDWPLWQLRVGVKVYDLLCSGKNLGKSASLTREEVLSRLPNLEPHGLTGGVHYYDAITSDARLVLDTLRSAVRQGANISNYLQFKRATRESEGWLCELEDGLDGKKRVVRAQAIINATGPWADGLPHSRIKLRLTKGIHIVVERQRVPVPEAVAITQGKRLLFLIPWGERVIIGTTDTDYQGSLEDVRTEPEDIRYLLEAVNDFFPPVRLGQADIVSTWAGLRPLIAEPGRTPSDVTRSHQIQNPEPGWWDLAGGKLTTYRLMAEQAVNEVAKWLKKVNNLNGTWQVCRTAREPLLTPAETHGTSGILPPAFDARIVEHFCLNEWAVHLDDVMTRRSGWHYYCRDARQKADQVADWMGSMLGWTTEIRAFELARYERKAGGMAPQSRGESELQNT